MASNRYRCPFCLKKFKNKESLAKHILYANCQNKNKKDTKC